MTSQDHNGCNNRGNTSKQWKHLTMATPQTIYTIALNTLETH